MFMDVERQTLIAMLARHGLRGIVDELAELSESATDCEVASGVLSDRSEELNDEADEESETYDLESDELDEDDPYTNPER